MFIILGAGGHVGSVVARELLDAGEPVTVVLHDDAKAGEWRGRGATTAVADVGDVDALRAVLRTGKRAFLLNPPAAVSGDTDAEERRTGRAIATALDGSGLEKAVAESTYGAQSGERIGDLSTLYAFEQALAAQPVPVTVQRAAYYMSNWDAQLEAARAGTIATMIPVDLAIPMVAPADLGRAAARFLREPVEKTGPHYVEGPAHYSANDVAAAFARALDRSVRAETVPRDEWVPTYRKLGFSEAAADSYARMTAVSVDGGFTLPDDPVRGTTTLDDYISTLVSRSTKD